MTRQQAVNNLRFFGIMPPEFDEAVKAERWGEAASILIDHAPFNTDLADAIWSGRD